MKDREIGQVSFSKKDNHEKKLWEHAAKQGKFSIYIKRLIDYDMRLSQVPMTTTVDVDIRAENEGDKEAAKGFI